MCPDGRLGAPLTPSLGTGTCHDRYLKSISGMKSTLRVIKDGVGGLARLRFDLTTKIYMGSQRTKKLSERDVPFFSNDS